ncbi:MAG: glycoside hydrolase family 127 protein, partial [Candidatus Sumerlaeota bacterium]|nr:glycoside hydrolase family 127 protein [Candidatus Sumerlaeota bacterium]
MYIGSRYYRMPAVILCAFAALSAYAQQEKPAMDYPIQPVPFNAVHITGGFWAARMETNRKVTIPACFKKCEETGRINNFAKAGKLMPGNFQGTAFDDSDVYKVIEGAAYALAVQPDPELDKYLDDLIAKIAAAQESDGYLYTDRTIHPDNPQKMAGPKRWSNMGSSHELYNVGHMYEAAVAHFQATGKRSLLDVAIKNANLLVNTFGADKTRSICGHPEIELALVKLYRATGDKRYFELAKFFIDEHGRANGGRKLYGEYAQDHKPLIEQDLPVGHAVRAGYFYSGSTDVAAITGGKEYQQALDKIWENLTSKKLALTAGVGARHGGEAFGDSYELPNESAYNETCAAIANGLWNFRMFLLEGDAKYMDVLERVIYNGFLSGVSLKGDTYFYVNPLESKGRHHRVPWFGCSCCPVNVARFVPSIAGFIYAHQGDQIFINLFAECNTTVNLKNTPVKLTQQTKYPWDGAVKITVALEKEAEFAVCVRIPEWAVGRPVPGDLYRYTDESQAQPAVKVNGQAAPLKLEKGYLILRRTWKKGDAIDVELPMPVRRVAAHENVKDDAGRVALERGPIVYCAEAVDNGGAIRHLFLPSDAALRAEFAPDLLGGVTAIRASAQAVAMPETGQTLKTQAAGFMAIPYFAWDNREPGEMQVFLAASAQSARPRPKPSLASTSKITASQVWQADTGEALNDQIEPKNSGDHDIPRFTWWDHRGTTEWVQYDFKEKTKVSAVEVYWFDDTGRGQCRAP